MKWLAAFLWALLILHSELCIFAFTQHIHDIVLTPIAAAGCWVAFAVACCALHEIIRTEVTHES